jgi:hypothetical protein
MAMALVYQPVGRVSVWREGCEMLTLCCAVNGCCNLQAQSLEKEDHFVIFEVFTAVTMKNVVFWDIKTQFVLHRRHITSPLQSPAS